MCCVPGDKKELVPWENLTLHNYGTMFDLIITISAELTVTTLPVRNLNSCPQHFAKRPFLLAYDILGS